MSPVALSVQIKALANLHVTQKELCNNLGCCHHTVNRYFRNEPMPTFKRFVMEKAINSIIIKYGKG